MTERNMLLKISYFLFLSILLIGIFHLARQWFQDYFDTYFVVPRMKKTDKVFEFVELLGEAVVPGEEGGAVDGIVGEGGIKSEEDVGGKKEEEELFEFIDGL
jgi:hypothetical protein